MHGHGFSAPLPRHPTRTRLVAAASSSSSRRQAEPLNGRVDPGPLLREEPLAFALQQQTARAGIDEHAAASLALDELLVDQLLIALQDRERIDPVLGRDRAHGRQRIAFLEHAVEDHGDDTVAKLAVDRLTVVPLTIHHAFEERSAGSDQPLRSLRLVPCTVQPIAVIVMVM